MFSLFQNRHPLAILFLVPLAALLSFLHYWFSSQELLSLEFVALQKSFELTRLDLTYLYFTLLSINAMVISTLFNRLNLIDYFSHIAGLFYVIFSFASVSLFQVDVLIAELCLILGLVFLAQIKNNVDAKTSVFSAAVFLGLGIVFSPSFAILLVLPFIALARSRSFVFREYLLVFVAYSIVGAYLYFYYFYYELKPVLPWTFDNKLPKPAFGNLAVAVGFVLLLLLSAFTRSRTLGSPGIRIERIVTLLFSAVVLQLLASISFFLLKMVDPVWYMGVFLALYVGYAYHFARVKFVYHFLGYAILIFGILQHFDLF
jgi:hypothetical protein